jgi:hypothetical protein
LNLSAGICKEAQYFYCGLGVLKVNFDHILQSSIGSVIAINAAKRAGDEDHSLKFGIEITAGVIPGRYIDAP